MLETTSHHVSVPDGMLCTIAHVEGVFEHNCSLLEAVALQQSMDFSAALLPPSHLLCVCQLFSGRLGFCSSDPDFPPGTSRFGLLAANGTVLVQPCARYGAGRARVRVEACTVAVPVV